MEKTPSVLWLDTSLRPPSICLRPAARRRLLRCSDPRLYFSAQAGGLKCSGQGLLEQLTQRTAATHLVPVAQKEINPKWRKQIIGVSVGRNARNASQSDSGFIYLFV